MTDYTPAQIAAFAHNAGFRGIHLVEAVAIALADSSGNASATSSNPDGGTNAGLWQLDTPGGGGAGFTVGQLQNPQTNADVAFKVSGGGRNWGAWETWATGAYRKFMTAAGRAAKTPITAASATGSGGGSLLGWPGEIMTFFKQAGTALDWLLQPSHWVRIFAGLGGGIMVLSGLWVLSHVGGDAS